MGLIVHSLSNVPESSNRNYFIYLLDYGWDEPIAETLRNNFSKMAELAAINKAVIIKGTEVGHFENEVLSWHQINNEDSADLLPALMITNKHPLFFHNHHGEFDYNKRFIKHKETDDLKLIIIPFKKFCKSTSDVIDLIQKIFSDIINQTDLLDFKITKELKKGVGRAIVDSIILEPNFSGVGISFKNLAKYLK